MNKITFNFVGFIIFFLFINFTFGNPKNKLSECYNKYLDENHKTTDWSWGVSFFGGQDKFILGAENVFENTYNLGVGFDFNYKRVYFNPELVIINTKSKADVTQNDHIFPKEAGVQILRYNINFGLVPLKRNWLVISPLIGISLNPFMIPGNSKDKYQLTKDLEGFHLGYTLGAFTDIYAPMFANKMGNFSKWGMRFKISYNSLHEEKINKLDGADFVWSIGFILNVFDLVEL